MDEATASPVRGSPPWLASRAVQSKAGQFPTTRPDLLPNLLPNWKHCGGNTRHRGACSHEILNSVALGGTCWSSMEHQFDRLQNGCSASFLVEGGVDSHAPPPPELKSKSGQPF